MGKVETEADAQRRMVKQPQGAMSEHPDQEKAWTNRSRGAVPIEIGAFEDSPPLPETTLRFTLGFRPVAGKAPPPICKQTSCLLM